MPGPLADGNPGQRAGKQAQNRLFRPAWGREQDLAGPYWGDGKTRQWAATVGKPALVVPEGVARFLRMAPGFV